MGPVLHINGRAVAPWLWLWAVPIPLLNNALPARFISYAFLMAGIIVALWLTEGRDRLESLSHDSAGCWRERCSSR